MTPCKARATAGGSNLQNTVKQTREQNRIQTGEQRGGGMLKKFEGAEEQKTTNTMKQAGSQARVDAAFGMKVPGNVLQQRMSAAIKSN